MKKNHEVWILRKIFGSQKFRTPNKKLSWKNLHILASEVDVHIPCCMTGLVGCYAWQSMVDFDHWLLVRLLSWLSMWILNFFFKFFKKKFTSRLTNTLINFDLKILYQSVLFLLYSPRTRWRSSRTLRKTSIFKIHNSFILTPN